MELRDKELMLLEDIYKCITMTLKQIHAAYYGDLNIKRFYRLMESLEKKGLIKKTPYISGGCKRSACVYLTDSGLKTLNKKGRARDIIDLRQQNFRVDMAEIYLKLKPHGWDWLNSRQAKREYNLNRNNKLVGILRGEYDYAVYFFTGKKARDATVEQVKSEIERNLAHGLRNAIVFYRGEGIPQQFGRNFCGASRLLLLPYPHGLKILAKVFTPGAILDYASVLGGKPVDRVETILDLFAEYLVHQGNRVHYLTELLTNDLARQYHLENYSLQRAKETGRGVYILVAEDSEDHWRSLYPPAAYPHFQYIPVENTWFNSEPGKEM